MSKTLCKYNTVLMGHALKKIKAIIVDKKLHQVLIMTETLTVTGYFKEEPTLFRGKLLRKTLSVIF
jgi:hypothetical protein